MTDESYSIKEMLARVEAKLDLNTNMTTDLGIKVGVQNGRVTSQEKWSAEAKVILESNTKNIEALKDEYKSDKAWIKGAVWVVVGLLVIVPTVCTLIFGLYIKNRDHEIDTKIQKGIETALTNRVKTVEYEK